MEFKPTAVKKYSDALHITVEGGEEISLPLTGHCVAPTMEISPIDLLDMGDVLVGDSVSKVITLSNVSPYEFAYSVKEVDEQRGEANWLGGREFSFSPARGVVKAGTALEIICRFSPDHPSDNYATTVQFGQYSMRVKARAHIAGAFVLGGDCTAGCVPPDVWVTPVSDLPKPVIRDLNGDIDTTAIPPPLNLFPSNPLEFLDSEAALFPALNRVVPSEDLLKISETNFLRGIGMKSGSGGKGSEKKGAPKFQIRDSLFIDLKSASTPRHPLLKVILQPIPPSDEVIPTPRSTVSNSTNSKNSSSAVKRPSSAANTKDNDVYAVGTLVCGMCQMPESKGDCTFDVTLKKGAFSVEPASGKLTPGTLRDINFSFNPSQHESSGLTDFVGQWIETRAQLTLKGGYNPAGAVPQVFDLLIRVFLEQE